MPNILAKFISSKMFKGIINSFGYISKGDQIVINEVQDKTDNKSGHIKALAAKIYFTYKKYIQQRNYDLELPDVKFKTIEKALRVESYLRRSKDRYIELIWKNGYDFIGKNKRAVNYIKRRFKEISYVTSKPTKLLFEEITEQLIPYYNSFILKVRNANSSSGNSRKYFGKVVQPVAGYFIVDINKIKIRIDNDNKVIIGYEYYDPDNYPFYRESQWDYRDVIHMFISKPPGKYFGEPVMLTVLDDVRALRRMEENVEILVFQHTIPLYQYTIGTNELPCKDGEVEIVKVEVENMMTQGMMVTPARHKIVAVGAQKEALDVSKYLEYFKTRILTGLGHSTVSLGEAGGASRASANVMEKAVYDAARRYQEIIKMYVNEFIINELLLEGEYDIFDDEQKVELYIPEIDLDSKIRKEFHTLSLYQGNILTEDEARKEMGYDPFTASERLKTYFELVVKPRTLMMAVDEPWLCYDDTTEILTKDGWKLFNILNEFDEIAVLKNDELKYEHPLKIISYDYNGKMYYLDTRFINLCVTPNHKLYISKRNRRHYKKMHNFEFVEAHEAFGEYKKFKKDANWIGKDIEYFILPEFNSKCRNIKYSKFPERKINIYDWAKFLAWYISEGNGSNKHGRINISQSKKVHKKNCKDIEKLINDVHFKQPYYGSRNFTFSDLQIKNYLCKEVGCLAEEKRIPLEFKQLSKKILLVFLDTVMKGDGEIVYHYLYSTGSKKLADDMQEIALKCGYSSNIRVEKRDDPYLDMYRVAIYRNKYINPGDRYNAFELAKGNIESWINYIGKIYCVESSTGVIYIRRNGKACWCGNSTYGNITPKSANKEASKNQHGTKKVGNTVRTKGADSIIMDSINPNLQDLKGIYCEKFESNYIGAMEEIMYAVKDSSFISGKISLNLSKGLTIETSSDIIIASYRTGIEDVGYDALIPIYVDLKYLHNLNTKAITKFFDDVLERIDSSDKTEISIMNIFESQKYRIKFISDWFIKKSYWLAFASSYKAQGTDELIIKKNTNACDICNKKPALINLNDYYVDLVPPFHSECECSLELKK